MIELPEAMNLAKQLNQTVVGKQIKHAIAAQSPHKFAWYSGDPEGYNEILAGRTITQAVSFGGIVEIKAENTLLRVSDGVGLRYHSVSDRRPKKHQMLIELEDGTAISASVQMYGGIWCFKAGEYNNNYHTAAQKKPSPLSDAFDAEYFHGLLNEGDMSKLSVKAFLATEQRIPGLGNGVLQDILWMAKIHPKRKMSTLKAEDVDNLFSSIKTTLTNMEVNGGRDTEKDLYGNPGGYKTALSKNNMEVPCIICDSFIKKESYMGGSIYFCPGCQKL